jgi:hypothetical protein
MFTQTQVVRDLFIAQTLSREFGHAHCPFSQAVQLTQSVNDGRAGSDIMISVPESSVWHIGVPTDK